MLSTLEMSKTTQKAEFDGQIQRLQCELSTKSQEVKDLKDKFDTVCTEFNLNNNGVYE